MNRYLLFTALTAGILSVMCQKAVFGGASMDEQNSDVSITITKFHVNDQTLELGWRITNDSDHDVWICESLNPEHPSFYEYFLDKDGKTLMLRRRFDIAMRKEFLISYPPLVSRYTRLRSSQEKVESTSLALPFQPYHISEGESANAECAGRLALEIGYYEEDLPGLILHVVDIAERLNYDPNVGFSDSNDIRIVDRFFGGWSITTVFKNFLGFSESVTSGGDEVKIPYMGQVINGEQVLRATVDGVSIPYKSNYPPLTDEPTPSETEPGGVTTVLTKFDVNDTNLELGFKIINNTDHDVWVCNGYERSDGSIQYFDRFMDNDNKTLVLRRQYSCALRWLERGAIPHNFRYLRLRPGQEKVESYSLNVPVTPDALFNTPYGNAESAQSLSIEIGFFDEDLRALILGVVDIAEKIGYDDNAVSAVISSSPLILNQRFFAGLWIAQSFKTESITWFRDSVMSDSDEILTPLLEQSLNGEQILRIKLDNVSIPYESNYPPLND